MANIMVEKAKLGKLVRTREILEKFREAIVKAYAMKKYIKGADWMGSGKLTSGSITWLVDIGCIEDCSEPGVSTREGRLYKWVYKGTETGVVDGKLVEALIEKERKYQKDWRDNRREGIMQIAAGTLKTENGHTKLPSGKKETVDQVVAWLRGEIEKNELVVGYLKPAESVMFPRIVDILNGLGNLREVVNRLNL